MKTPVSAKGAGANAGRQKKQLLALGGLSLVLVAVVVMNSGGEEVLPAVELIAAEPVAQALDAEEAGPEEPEAALPAGDDNPVLSRAPAEEGLARNPFKNFWSDETSVSHVTEALPAPAVTLNGTLTSEERGGAAVIDGQLRFPGDSIQGWELFEIHPRRIVLRAATQDQVVVEMPLLVSDVQLPESASQD